MKKYRLGLYEKALPDTLSLREMMTAAGEAGFDQLELSVDETDRRLARLDWNRQQRMDLVQQGLETGIPVRTLCLSGHRRFPLGSADPAVRARSMEILQKAVRLAADTGIRLIQLAGYDVYYEDSTPDTVLRFGENLDRAVDEAARYGVLLGFETMETPFMDTVSKGMTYVDTLNSPYLGMYPDLGNLTNACERYGSDVSAELQSGAGHTFAMHLKETVPGVYRDMDFGDGRVDFASGILQAQSIGVHLFTAEFWHDGRADWPKRLRRTREFLARQFEEASAPVSAREIPVSPHIS